MLTQAINSSRNIASQIAHCPPVPGAGQTLVKDANAFLQTVMPALSRLQTAVASFGTAANGTVSALLQQVASQTPPAQLVPQIHALAQQAGTIADEAAGATAQTNASRDAFSNDSAALTAQQVQLESQASALQSRRSHLESEAASLRNRLNIINGISTVLPIVKIADEIASLIQSSKLTEGQLTDVNHQLSQVHGQLSQVQSLAQQTGSLKVGSSQLASGVQSLSNTVNMIRSQLQNEQQFADAANAGSAELYLTALRTNLNTLQQIAD